MQRFLSVRFFSCPSPSSSANRFLHSVKEMIVSVTFCKVSGLSSVLFVPQPATVTWALKPFMNYHDGIGKLKGSTGQLCKCREIFEEAFKNFHGGDWKNYLDFVQIFLVTEPAVRKNVSGGDPQAFLHDRISRICFS